MVICVLWVLSVPIKKAPGVLTGFSPQYLGSFFLVNAGVIVLLAVVWVVYRAAMPILIERMSA